MPIWAGGVVGVLAVGLPGDPDGWAEGVVEEGVPPLGRSAAGWSAQALSSRPAASGRAAYRNRIDQRPTFLNAFASVALNIVAAGMFFDPLVMLPVLLNRRSLNTSKIVIVPFGME